MKDLSANPLVATNDVAGTYARLDSTYANTELFETARYGYQHLNVTNSIGASLTTTSTGTGGNTTGRIVVFVAPFALTVTNCWFSFFVSGSGADITLSDTNYWTFKVGKRVVANTETDIGHVATTATGTATLGVPLHPNTSYTLKNTLWTPANVTFAAGDLCQFEMVRTGTPSGAPEGILTITVSYSPI